MPDRLRTAFGHPLPERTSALMRERRPSSPDSSPSGSSPSASSPSASSPSASSPSASSPSPDSPSASGSSPAAPDSSAPSDDNPFAAPPEDRPDQPWQPRHPAPGAGNPGNGGQDGSSDDRPAWGSRWSDKQPGRQNGGFGSRPGGTGGQGGKGGPDGSPGGMRWDPTDPAQRRARYAVLGGMWAFFFALFDFPEIALLLGALAVYWSISALRTGPRKAGTPDATGSGGAQDRTPAATAPSGTAPGAAPGGASGAAPGAGAATGQISGRQQTTAAVSGLVTALLALTIVATSFTVELVYRDYYTCVNDALTKSGALACNDLLPDPLEPFFGVKK
ncbi:hypothetical protein OG596_14575 [Streptomyces sp. NBC_01102]|uniref:hypothetical protein n=1 Tax=Streptomyces sp. NBC_01102 TaxID=2903749 RepID=UPI003869C0FF|nr:hypothetical protein OG596_14575 [Streptomyces sp. NBC_01102]